MKKFIKDHDILIAFVFFSIFTLIIFPQVLSGYTIVNGNYLYSFEPWVHYAKGGQGDYNYILSDSVDWPNIYYHIDQIRNGELPLWGFNEQLGKPGIFLMNNLLVDPLRLILWIIFGIPIGQTIEILIKFTLGGLFSYIYLKHLKVEPLIAFACSIGFMFGTSQIASYIDCFSYAPLLLPLIFYLIEKIFEKNSWRYSLLLMFSLYYLASYAAAHVVFFSVFWVAMYILMRWIFNKERRLESFLKISTAGLLAIACFSIYLLPTIEYFLNGINLDYRQNYGISQLQWRSLYNLFFANIYGFPLTEAARWKYGAYVNIGIFVGFLAPVIVVSGSLLRVLFKKDFHIFFFVGSTIFLLCAIYNLPFESFEKFVNQLPLFHGNPPAHQTTFLQLFIFISGALGLQYLWETDFRKKYAQKIFIIIAASTSCTSAIIEFNTLMSEGTPSEELYNYYYWSLILAGVFLTFLLFIIFKPAFIKRHYIIFFCILSILSITEARLHSKGWVPAMKPEFWFPETEATNFLKSHIAEGRVMPLDYAAVPETLAQYGLPVAVGRGSVPRPLMHLLQDVWAGSYRHPTQTLYPSAETNLSHKLWDLLDVRFFVASKNFSMEKIHKYGDIFKVHRLSDSTILERLNSPQHAYFTTDGVVLDKIDEKTQFFNDPNWDIRRQIALENESDLLSGDSKTVDNLTSESNVVPKVIQHTNSITVDITTARPGYLLLSQYYYPGWNAYINGKKVDIFRAYYFLSAIQLPEPGSLHIEFRYEPMSLYIGAIITLLGVISTIILYSILIWRERRAKN